MRSCPSPAGHSKWLGLAAFQRQWSCFWWSHAWQCLARTSFHPSQETRLFHLPVRCFDSILSVPFGVRMDFVHSRTCLWRRKNRGRPLARATMILLLSSGITFLLVRESWWRSPELLRVRSRSSIRFIGNCHPFASDLFCLLRH